MPVRYSSRHDDSRRVKPATGPKLKRRVNLSSSRFALILSSIVMWVVTAAILAAGLSILLAWKRRQERYVNEFSAQIRRLARETGPMPRVDLEGGSKSLEKLGSAVNKLLENVEQRGARLMDREHLFQRLVETVHDAVLVHRDRIVLANSRFLALLNSSAADVVGRPLTDFVAPEYVELVANNLRRRLAGEPAAERYEVELVGAQAQDARGAFEHRDRQCR
jgi:PAS domain S-box-containing protein